MNFKKKKMIISAFFILNHVRSSKIELAKRRQQLTFEHTDRELPGKAEIFLIANIYNS